MRDCLVSINNNGSVDISCDNQYTGEHAATRLVITLNDELSSPDISYYTLVFNTGANTLNPYNIKFSSDAIHESSDYGIIENGIIYYTLPQALTPCGTLLVQVEAHTTDDEENIISTIKSPVFEISFNRSVCGDETVIPEKSFEIIEEIRKALLLINAAAQEIHYNSDSRHTHYNKKTLDFFSCPSLDTGFSQDISSDYLHWQGRQIAFQNGTSSISRVDEIEKNGQKFLRISLAHGSPSMVGVDYIDIPVLNVEKVKEELGPNITLNGSELNFGITNANGNKFIPMQTLNVTPAQTTALTPNTLYRFGEVATLTLDFTEGEADKVNEYLFSFISGATATVLTLPSSVKWVNELTVESNKRYEISVVDNIALWCAVDYEVTE